MSAGSILVTGATGFIGKHLTSDLAARGYVVIPHSSKDGDISHSVPEYPDIRHVFHLAGRSYVPDSWADPRGFYQVNLLGTINVLEFCRRTGAGLTHISSYVYGRPQRIPVAEDHPVQAFNPYSHSKILAEDACRFYSAQHGLRISIVRPFNIYGPGQSARFLIPTLVRQALDKDSSTIQVADDRPRRDFLYVSDFIRLLIATLERNGSGVYNAGSGISIGVGEIVETLNTLVPLRKKLVSRGEQRSREIFDLAADIAKAGRELNWKPSVDMAAGLGLTIKRDFNQ